VLNLASLYACVQIHIFEYAAGSMLISWATEGDAVSSETVRFGTTRSLGQSVFATSNVLTKNMTTPIRLHDAQLTMLSGNNQLYFYTIGDDNTIRNFTSGRTRAGGKAYLVLADLGVVNDVALSPILEATAAGSFDAVLHSGDCECENRYGVQVLVYLVSRPPRLSPSDTLRSRI
jgi:hypothetical protein